MLRHILADTRRSSIPRALKFMEVRQVTQFKNDAPVLEDYETKFFSPPGFRLTPHVKRLLLQAGNGSVKALQSLAPEVQEDVDLLIELMHMILLNIPNETHPLLTSTPDPNQTPDKNTRLGYTALHVLLRGLNGRTYLHDQGEDFKEELQLTITMLLWLLTIPSSGVVSIVSITPGCISLIARLYLLAVRMSLTTEESLLFAGRALQNILELPQSAWDPEFTKELNKTHPSVVNDILYRVIKPKDAP
ncbi:hypothetical protein EV359DRAFT_83632 [Lentinula novae-zelandiae]|nr:hypothetical protein EV359DRAFT_83632 [Lentinula novae-zelandiae]